VIMRNLRHREVRWLVIFTSERQGQDPGYFLWHYISFHGDSVLWGYSLVSGGGGALWIHSSWHSRVPGRGLCSKARGIINGATLCVQLECQLYGNGTHLASVLDLKEASVIAEYISGYQKVQPFWIGLHDPQKVTPDLAHKGLLGKPGGQLLLGSGLLVYCSGSSSVSHLQWQYPWPRDQGPRPGPQWRASFRLPPES
jgi:hypothetical protein